MMVGMPTSSATAKATALVQIARAVGFGIMRQVSRACTERVSAASADSGSPGSADHSRRAATASATASSSAGLGACAWAAPPSDSISSPVTPHPAVVPAPARLRRRTSAFSRLGSPQAARPSPVAMRQAGTAHSLRSA